MNVSIQKYGIPYTSANGDPRVEIRLPPYCEVLGIHGRHLIVKGMHDHERLVPKMFVVIHETHESAPVGGHRYLGTVERERDGESFLQYVFEEPP